MQTLILSPIEVNAHKRHEKFIIWFGNNSQCNSLLKSFHVFVSNMNYLINLELFINLITHDVLTKNCISYVEILEDFIPISHKYKFQISCIP